VPKPRVHLTRFHGVFAPHSRWRAQLTPAGRGSGAKAVDTRTPTERHRAMTWVQRLKRVFQLDLQSCEGCGGQVRVVASLEDPLVIGKILAHLETKHPVRVGEGWRPEARGSPPGRAAPKVVCSARKSWDGGDSGPRCRRLERTVRGYRRFGDTARCGPARAGLSGGALFVLCSLATLVEAYERTHFPMDLPDAVEAIKFRME